MNKKLSSRSLSALVFALGASATAAQANHDVSIQNLELSEESALSAEEFAQLAGDVRARSQSTNWGGSGSMITSGNYASMITSGNYSNMITAGNYANMITAGNYANMVTAGNYGRVTPHDSADEMPAPVLAEVDTEEF